jgi:hypothetical protein
MHRTCPPVNATGPHVARSELPDMSYLVRATKDVRGFLVNRSINHHGIVAMLGLYLRLRNGDTVTIIRSR